MEATAEGQAQEQQESGGPKSVAIVAMGGSAATYMHMAAQLGGRQRIAEEVWCINATAGVVEHDRAFVMDDVRHAITEQAREDPPRKVAQGILEWLPSHPGPVYTSTAYPEWPALREYPIEDVLRSIGGLPYLNNTVAYALAYAMYLGVREITLFGCDFTYPDRHIAESGRACVEYLIGIAVAHGVSVNVPDSSTLLDAQKPPDARLYGYHGPVQVGIDSDGNVVVKRGEECTSSATN